MFIDYDFEEIAEYYYTHDSAVDFISYDHLENDFLDYINADEDTTFDDLIEQNDHDTDTALYEYIVHEDYERSIDYAYFIGWHEQEHECSCCF